MEPEAMHIRLCETQNNLDNALSVIETFKRSCDYMVKKQGKYKSKAHGMQSENDELVAVNNVLQEEVNDLNMSNTDYAKQLKRLSKEYVDIEQQLRIEKQVTYELNGKVESGQRRAREQSIKQASDYSLPRAAEGSKSHRASGRDMRSRSEDVRHLQGLVDNLKSENRSLTKDVAHSEGQKENLRNENKSLTTDLARTESTVDGLKNENRTLKKDADRMESTVEHLKSENKNIQKDVSRTEERVEKLKSEKRNLSKDIEHFEGLVDNLRKDKTELASELEKHKQNVEYLRAEVELKRRNGTEQSNVTSARKEKDLQRKLHQAYDDLRDCRQELDETKTRLSKMMGQKLTDNNPNIADLGDKNRPTKLAERYSELYNNQWTDALEILHYEDEAMTIDSLRTILRDTMMYCQLEAIDQMGKLKMMLTMSPQMPYVPDVIFKQLKDCRKASADISSKHLCQKYLSALRDAQSTAAADALKIPEYTEECFELCWLMCVQDPPVVLGPEIGPGDGFDTGVYSAYLHNGPVVDYVVWPALFLHEGGALLCKGVAQGRTARRNSRK